MASAGSKPRRRRARAHRLEARLTFRVRDSQAFVEALVNPKPVNDRLRETVRSYRERLANKR
jgi:uncharacterized protein (DUF1778 family)